MNARSCGFRPADAERPRRARSIAAVLTAMCALGSPAIAAAQSERGVLIEPVATSTIDEALSALLVEELPPGAIVTDRTAASLFVRLERERDRLRLEARSPSGTLVLERTIELAGGLNPALRVAVLLVREAGDTELLQPPPDEDLLLGLELTPSIAIVGWIDPPTPRLGFGGSIDAQFRGGLRAGISVIFSGHICCELTTKTARGDAREVLAAAGAGIDLFSAGALSLGLSGALGAGVVSGEARGASFPSPGTPVSLDSTLVVGLVTVTADWEVSARLAARAQAGVRLGGRVHATLPAQVPDNQALDSGIIAPFVSLGMAINIF